MHRILCNPHGDPHSKIKIVCSLKQGLNNKGNKFLKNCLNFFPNLHSEGVIVKKLLCPKNEKSPLTYFDILELFRQ